MADTNNHEIKVIDMKKENITTVNYYAFILQILKVKQYIDIYR